MWRWDNEFDITLQYLILHLQTKCGYACSDQLRSTLATKSCTRWNLYVSSASWSKAGYRSSFIFGSFWNPCLGTTFTYFLNAESAFENRNPNIHSSNESVLKFPLQIYRSWSICPSRIDISDEFSFTHMLEFSKLAVAFAVELGGHIPLKL